MLSITGENVKIWRTDHSDGKNGPWTSYQIGVSNRTKDGEYENMYIDAKMPKDFPELPNGITINFEGFPSMRTDKNGGKRVVFVLRNITLADDNEGRHTGDTATDRFDDETGWKKAEEDIPF